MTNINIKDLLGNGEMIYDTLFTEGQFEWFKSNEDAYIYVRNTETGRNTRYNAEAQNGKHISDAEYFTKREEAMTRRDAEDGYDLTDEMIEQALADIEREGIAQVMDEMAENPEVSLEQFCEVVEKANQPKAKKPTKRAKKNAAYTGRGITLTEKQVDFIRHLPDTCYWENGLDSAIWVDCLCDEITGQFENKPMTVGAMISTICEKGLGNRATDRINGRKAVSFRLTELGKAVAKDLGL